MGWSHSHVWLVNIGKNTSAAEVSSKKWGVPAPQGCSTRKRIPHTSGYKKSAGIVAEWDVGLLKSQAVLFKEPSHGLIQTNLLWAPVLGVAVQKAPRTHREKLNCLVSKWELEGQVSPRRKCWQRPLLIFWVLHSHKAGRQPLYLSLPQPDYHCSSHPGDSLKLHPNLQAHPCCF